MRKVYACFLALAALLGLSAQEKPVELRGDVWAPYVLESNAAKKGFIVDIAKAALAKAGFAVDYRNEPWARALKETEEGSIDGAVGIYFAEARKSGFVVPEQEIGISVNHFYVLRDSGWLFSGETSLRDVVLGIIDGYDYGEINRYINSRVAENSDRVNVMYGDHALETNITMLLVGRITAIIDDQLVVKYTAEKMAVWDRLKDAGQAKPANPVGIAFSPRSERAGILAKALSEGIVKMRLSGELQRILDSYGVRDWRN